MVDKNNNNQCMKDEWQEGIEELAKGLRAESPASYEPSCVKEGRKHSRGPFVM